MKGQYFSFDAIVAAIIMITAFTLLFTYWFSMQYAVESRTLDLQSNAMRIADSLLTPGKPDSWETYPQLANVHQIGIASGFSNTLSKPKVEKLSQYFGNPAHRAQVMNLLRCPSNCSIYIARTDGVGVPYSMGGSPPANATDVAIVHRGGVLAGYPVKITVTIWR